MNKNERSGKWTSEEEAYAAALMQAFHGGILDDDVEEGTSLRKVLAKKLLCSAKRVSKKYEGTDYNGKMIFLRKANATDAEKLAKKMYLSRLREMFLESVERLKVFDGSRRTKDSGPPMPRANGRQSSAAHEHAQMLAAINTAVPARTVPSPNLSSDIGGHLSLRAEAVLARQARNTLPGLGLASNDRDQLAFYAQELLSRGQGLRADVASASAMQALGSPSLEQARAQSFFDASMRLQADPFSMLSSNNQQQLFNPGANAASLASNGLSDRAQLNMLLQQRQLRLSLEAQLASMQNVDGTGAFAAQSLGAYAQPPPGAPKRSLGEEGSHSKFDGKRMRYN